MPKKLSGQAVAVATGLWPVDERFKSLSQSLDGLQGRGYNSNDD
jgi:hypothetical protein